MPSHEHLQRLREARDKAQREAIAALERARTAGRSELTDIERRRVDDVAELNRRIADEADALERVSLIPAALRNLPPRTGALP
jgi:hypothetical protein